MSQTGPQAGPPYVGPTRPRSFVGPLILIVLGVCFLLMNLYPDFDPWPGVWHFWPLILIAIGIGKIWDSYHAREHPSQAGPWVSGTGAAWILVVVFLILVMWHGAAWRWEPRWHRHFGSESHDTQQVDLGNAKSVSADLQMPAGELRVTGGSSHLLDADFVYDPFDGKPEVNYAVSDGHGQLNINQDENRVHWGTEDQEWNLRLGNGAPIDMNVNMGAGQGEMHLDGLDLTHLRVNMGAGELRLYLTGPRKNNLDADVEGGVGHAMIYLPKDVGVHALASGGIGSIRTDGLKAEDGAYVNDVYGKTATSIDLTVHGGIGEIDLIED